MTTAPGPFAGPAAWKGSELRGERSWIHRLSPEEIAEIDAAVAGVDRDRVGLDEITGETFPLPVLGPVIERWGDELADGRGFVLVKGLPVQRMTEQQASTAYYGIGRHLGVPVSQNTDGDLLGHVRDTGEDPHDPSVRRYRTRVAQPFHVDGSDVVGLLCLKPARSGGLSSIVSSVSVYNAVREGRPDLVELFFEPFAFDLYEQQAPGAAPYFSVPLSNHLAGRLSTFYIRFYIDNAQRHPDVPRLTDRQVEFLDLVDELAASDELRLDMDFEPGDMQFLKNATILHARTAYEDPEAPAERRHLLRLWLTQSRNAAGGEGWGGIPTTGVRSGAAGEGSS